MISTYGNERVNQCTYRSWYLGFGHLGTCTLAQRCVYVLSKLSICRLAPHAVYVVGNRCRCWARLAGILKRCDGKPSQWIDCLAREDGKWNSSRDPGVGVVSNCLGAIQVWRYLRCSWTRDGRSQVDIAVRQDDGFVWSHRLAGEVLSTSILTGSWLASIDQVGIGG